MGDREERLTNALRLISEQRDEARTALVASENRAANLHAALVAVLSQIGRVRYDAVIVDSARDLAGLPGPQNEKP